MIFDKVWDIIRYIPSQKRCRGYGVREGQIEDERKTVDMTEMEILDRIKTAYQDILQDALVGIYVHGSLAFGCFRWSHSDIDFLVIVNRELPLQEKKRLITTLLDLDAYCPPKGLEMSIIQEKYCMPFVYPTPFELHYSNAHRQSCRQDLENYCLHMNGVDKDLAAHVTVTHKAGIKLCGKEIPDVFSKVPKEAYLDSIRYDIEDAVSEIEINPVYIILNLCRALAYLKEDAVLSKKQGGEWALRKLPETYCMIVKRALKAYCGDGNFNIDFCSQCNTHDFAEYMMGQIAETGGLYGKTTGK